MNKTAFMFALLAGIFWGIMGIFTNFLETFGFTSLEIVCLRLVTAALTFIIYSLIRNRKNFIIKLKDIPLLALFGISGVMMLSLTYFSAIKYSTMAVAASLMYTAPAIVIIASCILFKEKLTVRKIMALIFAFLGSCLVSGIMNDNLNATFLGVIFGLLSGIFYASYSIIGTFALRKHSSEKATLWLFIFAAVSSLLFIDIPQFINKIILSEQILQLVFLIIGIGIVSSFLPYILYTASLERTEASKAVIIASVEPLVAALTGFIVFGETLTLYSAIGIILIFTSVILTAQKTK